MQPSTTTILGVIAAEAVDAADQLAGVLAALHELEPAGPALVPDPARRLEAHRSDTEGRRHAHAAYIHAQAANTRAARLADQPVAAHRLPGRFTDLRLGLAQAFLLLQRAERETTTALPANAALFREAADAILPLCLALHFTGPTNT